MRKTNRKLNNEGLISAKATKLALLLAVVTLVGGGYYLYHERTNNNSLKPADDQTSINLDPPTAEEKKEAEAKKEEIANDDKNEQEQRNIPTAPDGKKIVKPVITFAGQYDSDRHLEVGSYVSEVFEDGGTCTLTLTKGTQKITRETTGTKDVSTTLCPTFTVPKSDVATGTWAITVSYSSATAGGTSASRTIEVQ